MIYFSIQKLNGFNVFVFAEIPKFWRFIIFTTFWLGINIVLICLPWHRVQLIVAAIKLRFIRLFEMGTRLSGISSNYTALELFSIIWINWTTLKTKRLKIFYIIVHIHLLFCSILCIIVILRICTNYLLPWHCLHLFMYYIFVLVMVQINDVVISMHNIMFSTLTIQKWIFKNYF